MQVFRPGELLAGALNSHPVLQRCKILFISGCILNRLNRNFMELEVCRANTLFQLMTILQEKHHSFLVVGHDPVPRGCRRDDEYVAQDLKQTSRQATIPLYAPTLAPHLQKMTEPADPGLARVNEASIYRKEIKEKMKAAKII